MSNNLFDPQIFELYPQLRDLAESHRTIPASFRAGNTTLDVNHPLVAKGDFGAFNTPMHVAEQRRVSIREHLIDTQAAHPDKLFLITGALATKVLMRGRRAAGIEFLQGSGLPNLYEADKLYDPSFQASRHRIYAKREVILSAGVFNTPQLLKLSGIGPARELAARGVGVVAHLPGVGRNLQDRYEITVNVDLNTDIELYTRCLGLAPGDPCLTAWFTGVWDGQLRAPFFGPYANNAAYAGRIAKSKPSRALPDLFIVGQATNFHGFVPGFSQMTLGKTWTWLILKAHTKNTAGTVKLRSTNPREMPEINFHYFGEGNDHSGDDLRAVVEGVKLARGFNNDPQASQHILQETIPGNQVQTDNEIAEHVKNEAWGHHASCTAKIGSDDDRMAVLDSRFRVRGVRRLRVVDACAFPRISRILSGRRDFHDR